MQKRTLGTKNALQRHYSERKTCFRPAAVLESIARYVLYILQRFSYKKVRKCNAKNLLKTYCIPEFQEIPEIRKKVSECNQRYSVFHICETTRTTYLFF